MIRAKAISAAATPLLSLETLRAHCEIVAIDIDFSTDAETHPDDGMLLNFLDAAIDHAEEFTGLSLILRTWEASLNKWPTSGIELPKAPLVDVVSITYGGTPLAPEDYTVDDYSKVGVVFPVLSWPAVTEAQNAVLVRFRAGFSAEADPQSDVPMLDGAIKAALLLTVGHLYEHRAENSEKALTTLPLGVEALLRPKRIRFGMA